MSPLRRRVYVHASAAIMTRELGEPHWAVGATERGWLARTWAEWLATRRRKSWAELQREKRLTDVPEAEATLL